MDYPVALDPRLGLTPEDFIEAWNADPEASAVASAQPSAPAGPPGLFDPLTTVVVPLLVGVASGVAVNLITELVRQALTRGDQSPTATPAPSLRVEITQQPDGTQTIVVAPSPEP